MPTSSPLPALQIDLLKITGYLLNLDSPQGQAKARYFLSYGFSPDDPNTFAHALFAHARISPLESRLAKPYGTSLVSAARWIAQTGAPHRTFEASGRSLQTQAGPGS